MLILAFDTSNQHASVALCAEHEVYGEYTWRIGSSHSVELLPRIQQLVAESHVTFAQMDAIAVATGPGSFNGIRVALATAKTLAFALQKPLFGISTLDCIAAQQQQTTYPVCAIMDAGRSEVYAACYQTTLVTTDGGEARYSLMRSSEYGVYSVYTLAQLTEVVWAQHHDATLDVKSSFLFCGEMSETTRNSLIATQQGFVLADMQSTRRASTLAELALRQHSEGRASDPLLLEPLYIRRPSITTSTRKRALLGAPIQRASSPDSIEREDGAVRD